MRTRSLVPVLFAAVAACVSEFGLESSVEKRVGQFRTDGDRFEVVVHADGFVRCADRRLPLEGFVLEMRQRLRAMDVDRRKAVLVAVRAAADAGPDVGATISWLVEQLQLMGVSQVDLS